MRPIPNIKYQTHKKMSQSRRLKNRKYPHQARLTKIVLKATLHKIHKSNSHKSFPIGTLQKRKIHNLKVP